MSAVKILAILFILAGGFGLAVGSFTFTSERHDAEIGGLEFSLEEKERVNVPQWIAAAAIGGGVLLLLFDRRHA